MRNNKRVFWSLVCIITVLVVLNIYNRESGTDKANKLFYKNVESIVELRAQTSESDSYGTAVFVGETARLVTNLHVVAEKKKDSIVISDKIEIRFANENDYHLANVISYDENLDLALLQVEQKNMVIKGIQTGSIDDVDFGNEVYAIGNSMNHGLSISSGIISIPIIEIEYEGINRRCIQSDVVIAPGNSGGALVDSSGKLIGITSFRLKDTYGEIIYGTAYSVPINDVINFINTSTSIDAK